MLLPINIIVALRDNNIIISTSNTTDVKHKDSLTTTLKGVEVPVIFSLSKLSVCQALLVLLMQVVTASTLSTTSILIGFRGAGRTTSYHSFIGQLRWHAHYSLATRHFLPILHKKKSHKYYNKFIQTSLLGRLLSTATFPYCSTMEESNNHDNKRKFLSNEEKMAEETKRSTKLNQLTSTTTAHVDVTNKDKNIVRPIVIVISGPTGSGKSDVGAYLCSPNQALGILQNMFASFYDNLSDKHYNRSRDEHGSIRGHIISADSVQAYRGVNIGANKPTLEERQITPYHLIDIVDSTNQYNAADWTNDAISVIDELSVNTWKVISDNNEDPMQHKSFVKIAPPAATLPVVVGGTMMYIQWLVHGRPDAPKPSPEDEKRAAEMIQEYQAMGNDIGWSEALKKVSSFGETFQKRTEKLCGRDWYRLRRLMEVALAVDDTATKIYTGERMGGLSTLGYDVRYFFLCPSDRMKHAHILDERCEQMLVRGLLEETVDLALSGNLPHDSQAARSIGYRQALSYLRRSNPQANDVTAFEIFLDEFTAATRQYSKKQMQWFRRDKECIFVPVDLSSETTKDQRIEDAAKIIVKLCMLSRKEYEEELKGRVGFELSLSEKTKQMNESQAKGMRVFIGRRHILKKGSDELKKILQVADHCTAKINKMDHLNSL